MQKYFNTWAKWHTLQSLHKMSENKQIPFKFFQACFKSSETPTQWRSSQEISYQTFRLSTNNPFKCWGPSFFSLTSKCLETHLICNNKFISNPIQKMSRDSKSASEMITQPRSLMMYRVG